MIVTKNLSVEQLKLAVSIAEQIETLEDKLAAILGSGVSVSSKAKSRTERLIGKAPKTGRASKGAAKKKGGISEAGRARIAAAQKERWAKQRKEAAA